MGIINYKKPAGIQGIPGTDGVSWSSTTLAPGADCPYGGILFTSPGGGRQVICNPKPRPEIYAQVISDRLLSTFAVFTFLNKVRIPVVGSTSYSGNILLNKQISIAPYDTGVSFEIKIDSVILQYNSQQVAVMGAAVTELAVPFTVTSNTSGYMEFEVKAKNTTSGKSSQIGPIFIRMD
jgi:hypothetical protein